MHKVKQRKTKKLKIELKTLLLNCIVYNNAEAYEEASQMSKTVISAKTINTLQPFSTFAKKSILDI